MGFTTKPERIDSLLLSTFLDKPDFFEKNGDREISIDKKIKLFVVNKNGSKIYLNLIAPGVYSAVHITNVDYKGESNLGIKIGDPISKINNNETYGPSGKTIEYSQGQFMIYPKKNLFFITDKSNKATQWATYDITKPEN